MENSGVPGILENTHVKPSEWLQVVQPGHAARTCSTMNRIATYWHGPVPTLSGPLPCAYPSLGVRLQSSCVYQVSRLPLSK